MLGIKIKKNADGSFTVYADQQTNVADSSIKLKSTQQTPGLALQHIVGALFQMADSPLGAGLLPPQATLALTAVDAIAEQEGTRELAEKAAKVANPALRGLASFLSRIF